MKAHAKLETFDSFVGSFIIHERTHMGLIEYKFKCHLCPCKYTSSYRLKMHMTSHSDERPFKCSQCQGTFKNSRALNHHVTRNHDPLQGEELTEICEFCGKGYRSKRRNSLKEHLISIHHLTKEEVRISMGMKKLPIFRVLENGDRVTPEVKTKPKTCSICEKTYVRREGLFTHLIATHGKTPKEAKGITGLESKRLEQIIPKSMRASVTSS